MRLQALAATALIAAGCAKGDALVVVSVDTTMTISSIANLEVIATANGVRKSIQLPSSPQTLVPGTPFVFGIYVPSADTGAFEIIVTPLVTSGTAPASIDDNTHTTSAGSTTDISLIFGKSPTVDASGLFDAGSGDGSPGDGPMCFTTCEQAGVGCGMITSCGATIVCTLPCELTAVDPVAGHVGDQITLEGNFPAGTTVNFNGPPDSMGNPTTVTAPAMLLGAERAKVAVPAGAITGPVTISSVNGVAAGVVPFKIVTFALGLQTFSHSYEQNSVARLIPTLSTDRQMQAMVPVGHVLLALGGIPTSGGSTGATNTFENADVNIDGTLQSFMPWMVGGTSGRSLVKPRAAFGTINLGNRIEIIGGTDGVPDGSGNPMVYADSEWAQVNGDGSGIQTFTAATNTLVTARYLFGTKIIGAYFYVFGGVTAGSVGGGGTPSTVVVSDTIERAPIQGSALGTFEQIASHLVTPRGGCTVEIIGNNVVVIGGIGGGSSSALTPLAVVEQAPINPDGTLGAFVAAPHSLDTGRAASASIVLGNQLYVLGGVTGSGASTKPVPDVISSMIDSSGNIGPFQPAGSGAMSSAHAASSQPVIIGNDLYLFGGGGGGGPSAGNVPDVERASINASGQIGTFSSYASNTVAHRTSPSALVMNNHLYVFGGTTSAFLSSIESAPIAPDGSVGQFNLLATTLSTARGGAGIAVLNNTIYVIGGGTASIEAFSVNDMTGALTANGTTAVSLTTARQNFQMVALPNASMPGGYLYVLGGDDAVNTAGTMERVSLDQSGNPTGTFLATTGLAPPTTMNLPHADCAGALIGGAYYLFGDINSSQKLPDVSTLDSSGALISFAGGALGQLVYPRWSGATVMVGNELLLLTGNMPDGGMLGSTLPDPSVTGVVIAPTPTGPALAATFNQLASTLKIPRRSPAAVAVGNFVYVLDGYDLVGNTDSNAVEQAPLK